MAHAREQAAVADQGIVDEDAGPPALDLDDNRLPDVRAREVVR